jgi:hypothetical protein
MTTKHTEGPWDTDPMLTALKSLLLYVESYGGEVTENIAAAITLYREAVKVGEQTANVRRAAPELLEALAALLEPTGPGDVGATLKLRVDQARAAIAKATGED